MGWRPVVWELATDSGLVLRVEEFASHATADMIRYGFKVYRRGLPLAESGPHGYATPQDAMEAAEAEAERATVQ